MKVVKTSGSASMSQVEHGSGTVMPEEQLSIMPDSGLFKLC